MPPLCFIIVACCRCCCRCRFTRAHTHTHTSRRQATNCVPNLAFACGKFHSRVLSHCDTRNDSTRDAPARVVARGHKRKARQRVVQADGDDEASGACTAIVAQASYWALAQSTLLARPTSARKVLLPLLPKHCEIAHSSSLMGSNLTSRLRLAASLLPPLLRVVLVATVVAVVVVVVAERVATTVDDDVDVDEVSLDAARVECASRAQLLARLRAPQASCNNRSDDDTNKQSIESSSSSS